MTGTTQPDPQVCGARLRRIICDLPPRHGGAHQGPSAGTGRTTWTHGLTTSPSARKPLTVQPDPPVEPDDDPRRDALRCLQCEFRADDSPGGWYEATEHRNATGHRYEHVRPAPKPLTVADIPAGQGPASLFLRPNIHGGFTVWFKTATGLPVSIHERSDYGSDLPNLAAGEAALWDHLAATLPHVTTEEDK